MKFLRRYSTALALTALAGSLGVTAGCSSSNTKSSSSMESSTTASPTSKVPETTVPIDRYSKYLELTAQLGGDVIAKEDAVIRASLDCSGAANSMMGGIPITEFPTDLALVRAYCPDKEADL